MKLLKLPVFVRCLWSQRHVLTGAACLLLLAACYFALVAAAGIISTNDGSHYALVRALAGDGTARIDPYVNYTAIQPAQGPITPDYYRDVSYYNGHFYSDRPPGTAFLAVPFYWLGILADAISGRQDVDFPLRYTTMLPPVLGAWTALALYGLARGLDASRWAAFATALGGALSTLVLKYATLLYSHITAAACVTGALALLLRAERDGAWGRGWLVASGLALGYSAVAEYPNLLLIGPVGAYLLWRSRPGERRRLRWPALVTFGLAWAAPVLLLLGYNWVVFGQPWTTSYTYQYYFAWSRQLSTTYVTPLGMGLLWLSVGPAGLLTVTPAFVLALWGLVLLARRAPARALLLAGVVLVVLIPTAMHRTFFGGGSRDTRYLVAIVPVLYAPLAVWLDATGRLRPLVARLACYALALGLSAWGLARSYLSLLTMFGHPAVERPPLQALALLQRHWREPAFVAPSLWLLPYFLVVALPLAGLLCWAWLWWGCRAVSGVTGRERRNPAL